MKRLLSDKRKQKAFLPAAFVFLLLSMVMAETGRTHHPVCLTALIIGAVCLLTDRILKPWDLERAEKRRAKLEAELKKSENPADNECN